MDINRVDIEKRKKKENQSIWLKNPEPVLGVKP